MIIKKIIQLGDPKLRQKSRPVDLKDIKSPKIKKIIKNLKDSFIDGMVIGMAAPQIGEFSQIFVTEIKETKARKGYDTDPFRIYINPKIIWYSKKETVLYEGCVSVPDVFGPVKRPERVKIQYYDENGEKFTIWAKDLLSKVIQHEYDHLYGIVFTDKITDNKKIMTKTEYLKAGKSHK